MIAPRGWRRYLRLGGTQTAFSASLLLMGSSLLSGVLSLVRQKLVAKYFGAGDATAAYAAAFQLPDMILTLLIGGVASAAFVTILSRHRERGAVAGDAAAGEAEGDRALSAVLNALSLVLLGVVALAMVFAPLYVRVFFPKFLEHSQMAALCVRVTRTLLIGPLFFFAGGVFAARTLVQKMFFYQAVGPVLYSGGSVLGALLLHRQYGVNSLAIGAMVGAFAGPLLGNWFGARRVGFRWSPVLDYRHPALREWLTLSLPLMLGQSLTTTDPWIRNHFISGDPANLSRLTFARQLFTAPMNVLGPAAGIASLPFFASLWSQGRVADFSAAVDRSVSRMIAVSLLLMGWMVGLAPLLIDLTLKGGSFAASDAAATTRYFVLYTLGLFLWTSQNLYARGFYGAGDTRTPMLSGTVVTALSIPVYVGMYRAVGTEGLVWAATVGMAAHTGALAVLLHRKRMVSLAELEWAEMGRSVLASAVGCGAILLLRSLLPVARTHLASFAQVCAGSVVWAVVVFGVLRVSGSRLPDVVLRRKR